MISQRRVYLYIVEQSGSLKVPGSKKVLTYFAESLRSRGQEQSVREALTELVRLGLISWSNRHFEVVRVVEASTISDKPIEQAVDRPVIDLATETSKPATAQPSESIPSDQPSAAPGLPAAGPVNTAPGPVNRPPGPGSGRPRRGPRSTSRGNETDGLKEFWAEQHAAEASRVTRLEFDTEDLRLKLKQEQAKLKQLREELSLSQTATQKLQATEADLREEIRRLTLGIGLLGIAATQDEQRRNDLIAAQHAAEFQADEAAKAEADMRKQLETAQSRIETLEGILEVTVAQDPNPALVARVAQLEEALAAAETARLAADKKHRAETDQLRQDLRASERDFLSLKSEVEDDWTGARAIKDGRIMARQRLGCGHEVTILFDPYHDPDNGALGCRPVNISQGVKQIQRSSAPNPGGSRRDRRRK